MNLSNQTFQKFTSLITNFNRKYTEICRTFCHIVLLYILYSFKLYLHKSRHLTCACRVITQGSGLVTVPTIVYVYFRCLWNLGYIYIILVHAAEGSSVSCFRICYMVYYHFDSTRQTLTGGRWLDIEFWSFGLIASEKCRSDLTYKPLISSVSCNLSRAGVV